LGPRNLASRTATTQVKSPQLDILFRKTLYARTFRRAQGAYHCRRRIENHGPRRHFMPLSNQSSGTNNRLLADDRPIENDCPHTDQDLVGNRACVHDSSMADGNMVSDNAGILVREVQHAIVLNIAVVSDLDAVDIT